MKKIGSSIGNIFNKAKIRVKGKIASKAKQTKLQMASTFKNNEKAITAGAGALTGTALLGAGAAAYTSKLKTQIKEGKSKLEKETQRADAVEDEKNYIRKKMLKAQAKLKAEEEKIEQKQAEIEQKEGQITEAKDNIERKQGLINEEKAKQESLREKLFYLNSKSDTDAATIRRLKGDIESSDYLIRDLREGKEKLNKIAVQKEEELKESIADLEKEQQELKASRDQLRATKEKFRKEREKVRRLITGDLAGKDISVLVDNFVVTTEDHKSTFKIRMTKDELKQYRKWRGDNLSITGTDIGKNYIKEITGEYLENNNNYECTAVDGESITIKINNKDKNEMAEELKGLFDSMLDENKKDN